MKGINSQRQRRKTRIRKKIHGTTKRPRLSVFRSNLYIYAQIIDDDKKITLTAADESEIEKKSKTRKTKSKTQTSKNTKKTQKKQTKTEKAMTVGERIAQQAFKKGIKKVTFDRGAYKFQGRVKALAESAKKSGLVF